MSGFSVEWLDLREGSDQRARNCDLANLALDWIRQHKYAATPLVVDLGSGTGSTLRALAAIDPAWKDLQWRLIDHDDQLLAEARIRHAELAELNTCLCNLSRVELLPLAGARLVTASALFDLVSTSFIRALIARLSDPGTAGSPALYAALTYNGTTTWNPVHPFDEAVLACFNLDQQSDKGFGPALGPAAIPVLTETLENAGYMVSSASSPWNLEANDCGLVQALINGIADAVAGLLITQPSGVQLLALDDLENWRRFRLAQTPNGTCTVGHHDLLALPAD